MAGFCFSNIMMLSFPEYFSGGQIGQEGLKETFSWVIFGLSLPVIFMRLLRSFNRPGKGCYRKISISTYPLRWPVSSHSAAVIMKYCLEQAPVILIPALVSSFMLVGRWFQGKTHDALSFDRGLPRLFSTRRYGYT